MYPSNIGTFSSVSLQDARITYTHVLASKMELARNNPFSETKNRKANGKSHNIQGQTFIQKHKRGQIKSEHRGNVAFLAGNIVPNLRNLPQAI